MKDYYKRLGLKNTLERETVRRLADDPTVALKGKKVLMVCAMHPTVLHEDSTLISGDFPHFTRALLNSGALPKTCPVIYHNGTSGNQSPRHVTRNNTFDEAQRLGHILGQAVENVLEKVRYVQQLQLGAAQRWVNLPPRLLPKPEEAERRLNDARNRLNALRAGTSIEDRNAGHESKPSGGGCTT